MGMLRVISDDDIFMRFEHDIRQAQKAQGGINVCDFVQKIRGEGFALGRNEGISLGENKLLALFSKLCDAGKMHDIDRAYLKQLMDEYQK